MVELSLQLTVIFSFHIIFTSLCKLTLQLMTYLVSSSLDLEKLGMLIVDVDKNIKQAASWPS